MVGGAPDFTQQVTGNAVFAEPAVRADTSIENITDSYGAADLYILNPGGVLQGDLNRLDLYPRPGRLSGPLVETGAFESYADWNRDFNGGTRNGIFRGAYSGEGSNPGWQISLSRKPE